MHQDKKFDIHPTVHFVESDFPGLVSVRVGVCGYVMEGEQSTFGMQHLQRL